MEIIKHLTVDEVPIKVWKEQGADGFNCFGCSHEDSILEPSCNYIDEKTAVYEFIKKYYRWLNSRAQNF